MIHLGKVAYVTRMHTSDGCDGAAGPERLFTTGWSACFINVIRLAAGKIKLAWRLTPKWSLARRKMLMGSRPVSM